VSHSTWSAFFPSFCQTRQSHARSGPSKLRQVLSYSTRPRANFVACTPFTETAMTDVDGSYAPQVNDFLTNAGYDVEPHEGEFVFFKEEENG
jgi:hypothetical protein